MTVKIDFQIETKLGTYSDALHLEDDHGLTEEQIEAMKQQRADKWVEHVESASAVAAAEAAAEANAPDEPVIEETPAE